MTTITQNVFQRVKLESLLGGRLVFLECEIGRRLMLDKGGELLDINDDLIWLAYSWLRECRHVVINGIGELPPLEITAHDTTQEAVGAIMQEYQKRGGYRYMP